MLDIFVNPKTGDIEYNNGEVRLTQTPRKIVRQELEITLRTFIGEWFNNTSFGGISRDYLGRVGISKIEVDAFYRRVILSNPDVLEITDFESSFNPISRQYDLDFTVRTSEGEVEVIITDASNEQTYTLPDNDIYLPPTTPQIKSASTFIQGSSILSAILSGATYPLVSQPILGTSLLSASHIKLLVPLTLDGQSYFYGNVIKISQASVLGSDSFSAGANKVAGSTITETTPIVVGYLNKAFANSSTGSSGFSSNMYKVLSTSIAGSSTLSGLAFKGYGGALSGTSDLLAEIYKISQSSITSGSSLAAILSKKLDTDITSVSNLSALLARKADSNITGNSILSGAMLKDIISNNTNTSNISASMNKRGLANVSGGVNTVNAFWGYTSDVDLTGNGYLLASATKIKFRGSSITNTGSLTANISKIKSTSAYLSSVSSITANIPKVSWLSLDSTNNSFSSINAAVSINNDGTCIYLNRGCIPGNTVQYALSTPYDISTISNVSSGSFITPGLAAVEGIDVRSDKYVYAQGSDVYLNTISNFDITTVTPSTPDKRTLSQTVSDVKLSVGETQLFCPYSMVNGSVYDTYFAYYTLSTAGDLTTINSTPNTSVAHLTSPSFCQAIAFNQAGDKMYALYATTNGPSYITEYPVVTDNGFSIVGVPKTIELTSDLGAVGSLGMCSGADGNLYITGTNQDTIYKYRINF